MKVAICEDQSAAINDLTGKFKALEKSVKLEYEISSFTAGSGLLKAYAEGKGGFDILIMDIELGSSLGIETAEKVREFDKSVEIIFITGYEHYVFDCFKVNPYDFMVKPISAQRFNNVITSLTKKICRERKTFTVKAGSSYRRIEFRSVEFFECSGHKIMAKMLDGTVCEFYSSIKSVGEMLKDKDFARSHRSFFVNLNCIRELRPDCVIMDGGSSVPISRSKLDEFKKTYLDYVSRELVNR